MVFAMAVLLFGRVPPCGAGPFLSGQKGTKEPLVGSFDEHLAYAVLIGLAPQTPITGDARRRKVRFIPDAQAWASVMALPCSSSPHRTRFAGLRRGPQ